jgi:two-component system response regulator NreC
MFRNGLAALLEDVPDIVVTGESGNVFDTLRSLEDNAVDVLVLDVNMPGPPTSAVLSELDENRIDTKVLVLTIHDDEYYLREYLKLGAKGFMIKTSSSAELVNAIRSVHKGDEYIDPSMLKFMVSNYLGRPIRTGEIVGVLTRREQEVCRLLALGYTNGEAAKSLAISKRTVETHRASIMAKLELRSRAELVKFAMDNSLLRC